MSEPDKMKAPLDTATVMALGVGALMVLSLIIAVYVQDGPLLSDLTKNFIGPGFLLIIGYYFGSSSSNRRKDETISDQASAINHQSGE